MFSNPRIVADINRYFVAFAGNIDDGGKSAPAFFQRLLATRGFDPKDSLQGHYVASPDGTIFSHWNGNRLAQIGYQRYLASINRGLSAFHRTEPPQGSFVSASAWPADPGKDVSVVTSYSRAIVPPSGVDALGKRWDDSTGFGYAGYVGTTPLHIYPEEVSAMLRASDTDKTPFPMPTTLVKRMAKANLCDYVRADGEFWYDTELIKRAFAAQAVSDSGSKRTFVFSGDFVMLRVNGRSGDVGFKGRIDGTFTLDRATMMVSRFRAYAEGDCWGDPGWHVLTTVPGHFTLGIAFQETSNPLQRQAPPRATDRVREQPSLR